MLKLRSAGHEDCRNRLLNRLGNVTRLRFHSLTLTLAMAVLSQSGCALFQRNSTGAASAKPSLFGPRPTNTSAGQPTAQRGPVRLMPPEANEQLTSRFDGARSYQREYDPTIRKMSAQISEGGFAPINEMPSAGPIINDAPQIMMDQGVAPIDVLPGAPGCASGNCNSSLSHKLFGFGKGKIPAAQRKADKAQFEGMGLRLPHQQARERRDISTNNPCFPRELRMASHPLYVVEPPDVLYIEVANVTLRGSAVEDEIAPVAGERLVRQDGTISLGFFGQMHVAGLTLKEIEMKIRERLKTQYVDPWVYVDVASFNSKTYYVLGQVSQIGRLPITGKETVLDALILAGGPSNYADLKNIHVARPNPGGGCRQVLWVDYKAITECGDTRTNFQLLPGDRVVVPSTKGFRTNVFLDNVLTPFERIASLGALLRLSTRNN